MKKQFVKPEIQKITLNFQENIVASYNILGFLKIKSQTGNTCALVESPYMYEQFYNDNTGEIYFAVKFAGCFVDPGSAAQFARSRGIDL